MIIDGLDIQVEFKLIKNTHLAVYPPDGRIHVSAPKYLTENDVRSYIISKWDWIKRRHRGRLNATTLAAKAIICSERGII